MDNLCKSVVQRTTTSVQPLHMKYQYISIKLRATGVAGMVPKVYGVAT